MNKINIYNKMDMDINILECPICLEIIDIEIGDYIELKCCKNKGHISCIENWIKVNKSDGKCYYCQQDNDFFKLLENTESSSQDNNLQDYTPSITIINVSESNPIHKFVPCCISTLIIISFVAFFLIL